MGGPTAEGLPLVLQTVIEPVAPPELTITRAGGNITISWSTLVSGFALESSSAVVRGTWTTVPNVSNNSVTLPIGTNTQFFRLRQ